LRHVQEFKHHHHHRHPIFSFAATTSSVIMDYHQARAKAETNKVDSRHHKYPATASTATTSQIEHYKQARERMINCDHPMREIQLLFPNERDRLDFREWMRDEAQKEHAARHPPVFEKEDLIRQVASGNFLDQGFLDGFIRMMRADRLPVLVVGNDAEGYYRLDVQAAAREYSQSDGPAAIVHAVS
jgi:hypothetical protein